MIITREGEGKTIAVATADDDDDDVKSVMVNTNKYKERKRTQSIQKREREEEQSTKHRKKQLTAAKNGWRVKSSTHGRALEIYCTVYSAAANDQSNLPKLTLSALIRQQKKKKRVRGCVIGHLF